MAGPRKEINIFAWDDDDELRASVIKPKILNLCQSTSSGLRQGKEESILDYQANQELQNILLQSLTSDSRLNRSNLLDDDWLVPRANLFTPPPMEMRPVAHHFPSSAAHHHQKTTHCTSPIDVPTPPVRAQNPMAMNSPFAHEDYGLPEGAELGLLGLSPPLGLFSNRSEENYFRRNRALSESVEAPPQSASSLICGTA